VALPLLTACDRYSEYEMRDRVAQFFPLGPTLSFRARLDCSAGAFRLIDETIGAQVVIESSIAGMINQFGTWQVVAVDDPELTPDAAMIEAANVARDRGMAMPRSLVACWPCRRRFLPMTVKRRA